MKIIGIVFLGAILINLPALAEAEFTQAGLCNNCRGQAVDKQTNAQFSALDKLFDFIFGLQPLPEETPLLWGNYCRSLPLHKKTVDLAGVSIKGKFMDGNGFVMKDEQVLSGINHCQAQYVCSKLGGFLPLTYHFYESKSILENDHELYDYMAFTDEVSFVSGNRAIYAVSYVPKHKNKSLFELALFASGTRGPFVPQEHLVAPGVSHHLMAVRCLSKSEILDYRD